MTVICPGCKKICEVRYRERGHSGEHRIEVHADNETFSDDSNRLTTVVIEHRCSWSKATVDFRRKSGEP